MARKTPLPTDALRIEYMPLDQLLRWPGNPKQHSESAIAASIRRFGFRDPLAIDEATGRLVSGHGRLTALERAHETGSPPPRFVQVADDGGWLIPVTRGGSFDNEQEAAAYLIATNKLVELGGWDEQLLHEMASDLPDDLLALTGFRDLDSLLEGLEADTPANPPEPSESRYKEQYGVIVLCRDEAHQEQVYTDLTAAGHTCKVVVT